MNYITEPTIRTLTESNAIIDLGDRDVIITELLPIGGMRGFTACEKLKEPRGMDKDKSVYPAHPIIIEGCARLFASMDKGLDYVKKRFAGYKRPEPTKKEKIDGFTPGQHAIIDFVVENKEVTAQQIAEHIGIPNNGVYSRISKLREDGLIDFDKSTGLFTPGAVDKSAFSDEAFQNS